MSILPEQETIWINQNYQPDNRDQKDQECPHFEIILLAAELAGDNLEEIKSTDRFCGNEITYSSNLSVHNLDKVFTTCEDLCDKLLVQLVTVNTKVNVTADDVIKQLSTKPTFNLYELQNLLKSGLSAVNHTINRDSIMTRWRKVMFENASIQPDELLKSSKSVETHFKPVENPEDLSEIEIIKWVNSIYKSLQLQTGYNCRQHPK